MVSTKDSDVVISTSKPPVNHSDRLTRNDTSTNQTLGGTFWRHWSCLSRRTYVKTIYFFQGSTYDYVWWHAWPCSYGGLFLFNLFAFLLPVLYSRLSGRLPANTDSNQNLSCLGASLSQYTGNDQFRPSSGEQVLGNTTYTAYWNLYSSDLVSSVPDDAR